MKLKVAGVGLVLALAGVAAAIALGAAGGGISVAPKDAAGVITISGIDGGDPGSPTIDVLAFSWSVSNTFTGSHGGGGGAGKANFQDLSVTKLIDKASPLLAKACATGQHIQTVILNLNRPGGPKGAPYMQYKLDDVFVTSVSHGGSGDNKPTENVSFAYGSIKQTYTTADGSETSFNFNLDDNRVG
jgi:type VI secretion system Hcp family effector